MILHGRHLLKSWSSTQSVVALSSGEAEYYGLVKGASEGLGLQSVLGEGGNQVGLKLLTDSSAAKGICSRLGFNKRTRHIAVCMLWLQQKVDEGEVEIQKVPGHRNPADLGTKHLAAADMSRHMETIGLEQVGHRHELMPELCAWMGEYSV